ncbi:MAG: hypothetical protein HY718_16245 [Planctomycetes bacterium]|nr:hypothetical protein [Planctomycetota bacterium]
MDELNRTEDQTEMEAAIEQDAIAPEPSDEQATQPAPPPLEVSEMRLGRLQVPEDADDILSFVHRQPGVVHVWMTGNTICVESEPGAFDCEACVEQLADQGFPVSSAAL